MNPIQDLKLMLLDKFGIVDEPKTIDFCREAYKFLMEGDVMKMTAKTNGDVIIERVVPDFLNAGELTAVDLGLPSGTLWADRNLGAKSPSDYGAFVSWGNTDLYFPEKGDVDWGDNDEAFKDPVFTSNHYDKTPGAQLDGDIDLEHDAAYANLGGDWRMPTKEQFQELYDNCRWIRSTVNGVNGYLVVSKINKASIFFACSGNGNGTSWNNRGSLGRYWSASFYSARYAYGLYFYSGGVNAQNNGSRCNGFAVRPVQNIVSQE
jgi:hypothetical protein